MAVFHQQERKGIIERFVTVPEDFTKHIWIPHRPVFKTDEQTTTMIRSVFNCSQKANGKYSLNEAAYPGKNLMVDMLEFLLLFRTNKYVLLEDIRKAFLMINFGSLEDRNRFCFSMEEGNELVCFGYTTIIFGFNASPFYFEFHNKTPRKQVSSDNCIDMLKKDFYVDFVLF